MKKNFVVTAVIIIFWISILSSCSKSSSGNNNTPKQCNFETNTVATSSDIAVAYSATNSSGGSISSLIYKGPTGPVTVTNPTLPWSITVTIPKGDSVNIAAVGSAPSGSSLTLSYTIQYSNSITANTVSCGN